MKKYILIIILIALFACLFYIYKLSTYTYITAKFKELRPIHNKLKVYYKGIVVGNAREIKHSDSFEHTLIKIVLRPKNLLLPDNTEVHLKKEKINDKKERDFLELIYPKEPSNVMIKSGATLEGIATVDLDTFLKNQHPDDIEEIKQNIASSAESLSYAMEGLNQVFNTIDDILKQNKPNLYNTTKNINNMTSKLDNSINYKAISSTFSNIDAMTESLSSTTKNADSSIPETLDSTKGFMNNLDVISCGIRKTLGKRAGGIRLFFGKVIDECN